jgi:hypothetical protein
MIIKRQSLPRPSTRMGRNRLARKAQKSSRKWLAEMRELARLRAADSVKRWTTELDVDRLHDWISERAA